MKYQLTPVTQGVKPSLKITITKHKQLMKEWEKHGERVLHKLQLEYKVLRETHTAKILIIYTSSAIKEILEQKDVRGFLEGLNYPSLDVEAALNQLVERYQLYHCPHELGLFLGIPLEDVKDFMECGTKECKLCGYWKVYNDPENALKIFAAYDQAKKVILTELLEEFQLAI